MEIKITYQDEVSSQILREIIVEPPEVKGLDFLEEDFIAWHEKAGRQKSDSMIDRIVEESGQGSVNTPKENKEQIVANLSLKTAKQKADEEWEDIRRGLGILPKKEVADGG